jgi:hypothetical protein
VQGLLYLRLVSKLPACYNQSMEEREREHTTFTATLRPMQSALSFHGAGDGARIILDAPASEVAAVAMLLAWTNRLLRVTIEPYDDPYSGAYHATTPAASSYRGGKRRPRPTEDDLPDWMQDNVLDVPDDASEAQGTGCMMMAR